jgi:hypothetical protein
MNELHQDNELSPPIPKVDYVDCPRCLALPPVVPTGFHRPDRITDPLRVRNWSDLVTETEWKHHVDEGGIIAYYALTNFTDCSLGSHPHKNGDIVRTRCGLILRLGWKCAANSVHG